MCIILQGGKKRTLTMRCPVPISWRRTMTPRIGITARYRKATRNFCVQEEYVKAVARAGGVRILIPFGDVSNCGQILCSIDGLLLTGGEDIDPLRCGGAARQSGYDYYPDRDDFEFRLTQIAIEARLPTLGICRGCQVLYVATGHALIPHIPDILGNLVSHRRSITEPSQHFVALTGGSRVLNAYAQRSLLVTSYHHQGLQFKERTGSPWRATAYSDDSLVEAIEYAGEPWIVGVLWQPGEGNSETSDPLISAFVATAGAS